MTLTDFFKKDKNEDGSANPSYFYIYFPSDKKANADKLSETLKSDGYNVKLHQLASDVNPSQEWSLVASKILTAKELTTIGDAVDTLEQLAEEYGGDYDGHEIPV